MKRNEYDNEKIRLSLVQKTEEIEPSEDLFSRIKKDIYEERDKKRTRRGVFQFKRGKMSVAMLTCCILLIISTVVIGSTIGGKSWISKGYLNPHGTFPKVDRVVKDVGFAPKYVEILPGGFEFSKWGSGQSQLLDESGNVVTNTNDVDFIYIRGADKSSLSLNVSQVEEEFIDNSENKLVDNYNGIDLRYYQKDYKFVPPDYQLTEEDKRAYEAGKLEISVGTSEISYSNVQSLSWYEDGLLYMIMGGNFNFTVEEMIEMSKAIIDSKKD